MTVPDAREIAAGLTKAGRRTILCATADWQPGYRGGINATSAAFIIFQWPGVIEKRQVTFNKHGWARGEYRLTPLGQQVAAILKERNDG